MEKNTDAPDEQAERQRPCIPPVTGDTHGLTPFNWSMKNFFSSLYWYGLMLGCFFLLYTPEVLRWYRGWSAEHIAPSSQADVMMLVMAVFWISCLVVPLGATWLLLRMRKKAHD